MFKVVALTRGFPTRMVYLKNDIYSRDTPFWSGTLAVHWNAFSLVSVNFTVNIDPTVLFLLNGLEVMPRMWEIVGTLLVQVMPDTEAALPEVWRYRISARTGWPVFSML